MDAVRYKLAKQAAERFLIDQNITSLPVDPISIAESLGITVKAKPDTAEGVSGMLIRQQDMFGILYATHINNDGFQRFSIAHEIGHYMLDGHVDHIFPANSDCHSSHAGFVSGDPFELEADHFAAGLLMPDPLFSRELRSFDDGFAAVEGMARLCRTSLIATALRYAEKASVTVAIVVSTGNTIDYCFMSEVLQEFDGIERLGKGHPLPTGVETDIFNQDPENIIYAHRRDAETDLRDWFSGPRSVPGIEEVIGLGRYGKTLTVLSSDVFADEEDDEGLEECWTPRFRK